MPEELNPATGTADVSSTEDFASYEARYYAERSTEHTSEAPPAVVAGESKTATNSEPVDDKGTADEEADDDDASASADDSKQPRRKGGYQKKIDKLTAKIRALEGQLAQPAGVKPAEQTTENKETTASQPQPDPNEPNALKGDSFAAKFDKPKPTLEDCASIEEFTEKLTDWKADEREFAKKLAERKQAHKDLAKASADAWEAKQSDARTRHADYDDVLKTTTGIVLPRHVQAAILESDLGADIAYELANDHTELKRIAGLSVLAAARAIGKIEARLEAQASTEATPTPKPKVTNAPKPPSTVSGGRVVKSPDVYSEELASDFSAWEKARNAELRNRR